MRDPVEFLKEQMMGEKEALTQILVRGISVNDFPQYKFVCGQLTAVDMLLNYIDKLEEKMEEAGVLDG